MEGHICRQNALMFALVFCFELCARAVRTCCHCHLAVKIRFMTCGQFKTAKKVMNGTTVWSCDTDCVQMASKQPNVEFSSHIFQFTRLHSVADMQGLPFRDSVVTLIKSSRWYVLSGTGFLVAHQLYIGNVMRKYQIGKSSPHQPCENTCHSNVLKLSLLWMARGLACFQSQPKIRRSSDGWLKKVWISAIFSQIFWNYNKMKENKTNLWRLNSDI